MPARYLFGPVARSYADQHLNAARASGECLAFNSAGDADLQIDLNATWESIRERFSDGWSPEFIVLNLAYARVPPCFWSAPIPIVGLAPDWHLLWHQYLLQLPRCELVLTDEAGVERCQAAGIAQARFANLNGLPRDFPEPPEGPRDIDLLFVGNLHPAVERGRFPWLGRIAALADRYRVLIHHGGFGNDHYPLLARAKIVFQRGTHGECSRRTFEAAAMGALVFQEAENREIGRYFEPGREFVAYDASTLESLLVHYLENEAERQAIATAGEARARDYSFERMWAAEVEAIARELPDLQVRRQARPTPAERELLMLRAWEALGAGAFDESLIAGIENPVESTDLAVQAGLLTPPGETQKALAWFRRAWELDNSHVMAALNLAEALKTEGQADSARRVAERLLAELSNAKPNLGSLRLGHYPPRYDAFRVEWEKAAWTNAGNGEGEIDAKLALVRWRLLGLLGELTGDASHYREAVTIRPDLAESHASLGQALAQADQWTDAVTPLIRALDQSPFDVQSARTLFHVYGRLGDGVEQKRLARPQRTFAKAAPQVVPHETWMASSPPLGDELASILVLCCNELEYTKLCLESVLAYTRQPYELVLVDNGSTDETPAYLESLRNRPGPERVVVIRNETNRGFAGGVNQALDQARGEYLVLLNNDTIVTAGWLSDLIACAIHGWPKVGLVGPVTNYAAPPQQVSVDYTDPSGIAGFALKRQRTLGRQAREVERLTGFCLLIRRDVLEKIGGMDERYGLGFFEDDDLCVRARSAGFTLALALDVFIHHFGSRTFAGLGIDGSEQLLENFAKFQEKWGPERAAGYRMPDGRPVAEVVAQRARGQASVPATARPYRGSVSLTMIVKNEEKNIADCLRCVSGLFDEIIVIDTGSTDRTREIATQFGAKVYEFPWIDSFAAARNEALRHATVDWVFWLDADDRIDAENHTRLERLFRGLKDENAAYVMKCLCVPDFTGVATVVDHLRLFRNRPDLRWRYRVHEQILPALRASRADVRWSDVVVHHTGYVEPGLRRKKLERDLRLLTLSDAEEPEEPFIQFNLGQVLQELGDVRTALRCFQTSLARSHPTDSIVRKLYHLCCQSHRQLNELPQALEACRAGRRIYPDDPGLIHGEGCVLHQMGQLDQARETLLLLLQPRDLKHFASVDAGLTSYVARHNLALVCRDLGRIDEAITHWRAALGTRGNYQPAWFGLGELLMQEKRWDQFEQFLGEYRRAGGSPLEAAVFAARGAMVRSDFAQAKTRLQQVIAQAPQAVYPRVLLSFALLQEGKDLAAAEEALRDVLTLDPANREAAHNLRLLLEQRASQKPPRPPTIVDYYNLACRTPSDINEHLPALCNLARECKHVTEFGTRTGVSTTAFLFAQPERLVCYDVRRFPEVDRLMALPGRTDVRFIQADVLGVEIEETDLLFIDTLHDYEQLKAELARHAAKARKYIVLHDTTTFGENGETPGKRGLWPAVDEFLKEGNFRLLARYENNNGLTILRRV